MINSPLNFYYIVCPCNDRPELRAELEDLKLKAESAKQLEIIAEKLSADAVGGYNATQKIDARISVIHMFENNEMALAIQGSRLSMQSGGSSKKSIGQISTDTSGDPNGILDEIDIILGTTEDDKTLKNRLEISRLEKSNRERHSRLKKGVSEKSITSTVRKSNYPKIFSCFCSRRQHDTD